ncbi:hypothetical protein AAU61_21530 [Desulfocarbo indianensis]|nr:hypothetical protein AAU61_21530 [Desulfocarbo indianensis]
MRDRVWLSADLCSGHGYQALHRWLAGKEAKECGGGLFTFFFEHRHDLVSEMSEELNRLVSPHPDDRIYLIYKDPKDGEVTGLFLFGQRGPSPWRQTH